MSPSPWLIFFSSLPSQPVGNRVGIWRKLVKSGAVQLAGAAYVLPDNREHAEFFQWLAGEINRMGGEAAFIRAERVEPLSDEEIVAIFARRKAIEYRPLVESLDVLERTLDGARQAGRADKGLRTRAAKLLRDIEAARRTDFFASAVGNNLGDRIARMQATLSDLADVFPGTSQSALIPTRTPETYRGRRWVTRRTPFVDRMASAWLIRTFIDPAAAFGFIDEDEVAAVGGGVVAFDVRGGEFAHVGDLCTCEVLVRTFGLKDPAIAKIVEIVHDLDVKDDRYRRAETPGVEAILAGVRRAARDDADALERGIAVFGLLHAAAGPEATGGSAAATTPVTVGSALAGGAWKWL